jgi:hypothetical protein
LWRSVLLGEETAVPGENHQPAAGHWQLSFKYNKFESYNIYYYLVYFFSNVHCYNPYHVFFLLIAIFIRFLLKLVNICSISRNPVAFHQK